MYEIHVRTMSPLGRGVRHETFKGFALGLRRTRCSATMVGHNRVSLFCATDTGPNIACCARSPFSASMAWIHGDLTQAGQTDGPGAKCSVSIAQ